MGWISFFVIAVQFQFADAETSVGESIRNFQANLVQVQELWESQLERSNRAHEIWMLKNDLLDLTNLEALASEILERGSDAEWLNYAVPILEESFSNFLCQHVLVSGSEILVEAANQLHSQFRNKKEDYDEWIKMLDRLRKLRQYLQNIKPSEDSEEADRLNLIHWALDHLYIDISNLLFHNSSRICVASNHREPKSLDSLLRYSSGFRSPHEKFYIFQYAVHRWKSHLSPASLELPDLTEFLNAYDEFEDYLVKDLAIFSEPSEKRKSNEAFLKPALNRLEQPATYRIKLSDLELGREVLAKGFYVRIDLVAEVYDAYGRSADIFLPIERSKIYWDSKEFREEFEFSSEMLSDGIRQLSYFDLIHFSIRVSVKSAGTSSEGECYLDFGFRRRMGSPFFGLNLLPKYFPVGSQHEGSRLSQWVDIGHSDKKNISENRVLFLEKLNHIPVPYDQIIIQPEDGGLAYKIPIVDEDAIARHSKVLQSLHVSGPDGNLVDLKYDANSEILLKFKMEIQISEGQ